MKRFLCMHYIRYSIAQVIFFLPYAWPFRKVGKKGFEMKMNYDFFMFWLHIFSSFKYALLLSVQFHQPIDFFCFFQNSRKIPKYKSCFQDYWLDNESFKVWLKKNEKKSTVLSANVCPKSLSIGNGGIENLKHYAKAKKHEVRCPASGRPISFVKSSKKDKKL